MADPKPKSIEAPDVQPYYYRRLPQYTLPGWVTADRWRLLVRSQPIAILARQRLITYLQTMPLEIRAKDPKEEDKYADDIEGYGEALSGDDGLDHLIDLMWQDALDLPIGGCVEVVRWPKGKGPYKGEPGKWGHLHSLHHIDGATMFPTWDRQFPMAQRVPGQISKAVYFKPEEVMRILLTPRPEWDKKGWGMAPPERIYLAIQMLVRGDVYYANLLIDTPEAGILDLLDMEKDAALQWITSTRDLLMGIDPMKVPVLYEHDKPAVWIPFTRPPSELSYDAITLRFAKITAAGYWLALTDLGLEAGEKTLTGQIRDERRARLSGFGLVAEKTINALNRWVLPPYLEAAFVDPDPERLIQFYKAFTLAMTGMKAVKETNLMSPEEAQKQLVLDGLIKVEVEPPPTEEELLEKMQKRQEAMTGPSGDGFPGSNGKDGGPGGTAGAGEEAGEPGRAGRPGQGGGPPPPARKSRAG